MRIYTGTGDKGETSLASGKRVPKYHYRLEAYGTIDELNSVLGWARVKLNDSQTKLILRKAQNRIFTISSFLAMDDESQRAKLPSVSEDDIKELEQDIDRMQVGLPALANFILPAGHESVAACHMARTVCRRAERLIVKLADSVQVEQSHLKYINRLSDYLFVAARKAAFDTGTEEELWYPDYQKRGF
ncbi:MAG: cob(I)yrinic acid a,c-diamide adenosyltransferase [Bacteroidetes bacterium]|nr:cob(I)yrinic acid a,c-diamide adenosyltransferase [Bacteroidota bacterium]